MSRQEHLAVEYSAARARLVRIAYAVLGSHAEAEDVVSETWLRLTEADAREPVRDVEGWSVVAVARRALDLLRSARVRRESYVGPWLPEPVLGPRTRPGGQEPLSSSAAADAADPADRVTLDESVSFALLVVLESLTPAERTAWVLHDLFALPFPEVADAVGRSPAAVRQLAARARRHITAAAPRLDVDAVQHEAAVSAFLGAAAGRDLAGLIAVLDPDVIATSDGGGQVSAARRPVHGADRVARFVLGLAAKLGADQRLEVVAVNGITGFAVLEGDRPTVVASLVVHGGRIRRLDFVLAPDKLPRHLVLED
ncbi:MAG: RNA polymerase sigma factor SigJ [Pseudonocardia sp.]|nr:RNA polymerase sigma factor SigJ [Pseudonocardia sp.]